MVFILNFESNFISATLPECSKYHFCIQQIGAKKIQKHMAPDSIQKFSVYLDTFHYATNTTGIPCFLQLPAGVGLATRGQACKIASSSRPRGNLASLTRCPTHCPTLKAMAMSSSSQQRSPPALYPPPNQPSKVYCAVFAGKNRLLSRKSSLLLSRYRKISIS
jgi:hypothetical protein